MIYGSDYLKWRRFNIFQVYGQILDYMGEQNQSRQMIAVGPKWYVSIAGKGGAGFLVYP